jgi:hypothetical protein
MVRNEHQRILPASADQVGALVDRLASKEDILWPGTHWPAMRFDRPLSVGAVGGHGPIRYVVTAYTPGRMIEFRFTGPEGFVGTHSLHVESLEPSRTRLRHLILMHPEGSARLSWPLLFRHLHDALIEDALDNAERYFVPDAPKRSHWSWYVRFLRWLRTRVSSQSRKARTNPINP